MLINIHNWSDIVIIFVSLFVFIIVDLLIYFKIEKLISNKKKKELQELENKKLKLEEKIKEDKEKLALEEKERLEKRLLEEKRLDEEKKLLEEKSRLEREKLENEKKLLEEKRLDEEKKLAEERKTLEEKARIEREKLQKELEEKERLAKEKRLLDEKRLNEERLALEEKARLEREKLALEEKERLEKRLLEEKRLAEEKKLLEEKARLEREKLQKELEEKGKSFKEGLEKTQKGFFSKITKLFKDNKINEDLFDELEELLLSSDIGPKTADKLFDKIKDEIDSKSLNDSNKIIDFIKKELKNILDVKFEYNKDKKPYILLFIGVNGSGKTTTIGKLASQYKKAGKQVLLIAGDTFRAAAVEQLEVWAERSKSLFYSGKENQDPSSVIFDGVKKGISEKVDIIIIDTSGRLHTDKKLMEELKKIGRTIDKSHPGAPHDTFLVLDSTNGQNAIFQAKYFNEAMDISGIVLTKLDGTAKGGVIIGICDSYKVPVPYVGIGEGINDLKKMNISEFVDALF